MQREATAAGVRPAAGGVERDGLLRPEEGATQVPVGPGGHRGVFLSRAHSSQGVRARPAQRVHDDGGPAPAGRGPMPGPVQCTGGAVQVRAIYMYLLVSRFSHVFWHGCWHGYMVCVCVCVCVCVPYAK